MLAPLLVRANFDPMRDFTAVFNAAYTTSVLVVNDRIPASTVAELVAYARARPGVLNYASSGVGSANHIDTEVFIDNAKKFGAYCGKNPTVSVVTAADEILGK